MSHWDDRCCCKECTGENARERVALLEQKVALLTAELQQWIKNDGHEPEAPLAAFYCENPEVFAEELKRIEEHDEDTYWAVVHPKEHERWRESFEARRGETAEDSRKSADIGLGVSLIMANHNKPVKTCRKCMGSGYWPHPHKCAACNGAGRWH